jgi:hypothetical protein
LRHFNIYNASFYRDRLGTDIGKALKKREWRFLREEVQELVERLGGAGGEQTRPKARPGATELECYLQLDDYLALPQPRTRQVRRERIFLKPFLY